MWKKLRAEGHDIVFVGAHGVSAIRLAQQEAIEPLVSYPLLQEEVGAELRAYYAAETRHAILLFDAAGQLVHRLPDVQDAATAAGITALEATIRTHLLGGR